MEANQIPFKSHFDREYCQTRTGHTERYIFFPKIYRDLYYTETDKSFIAIY